MPQYKIFSAEVRRFGEPAIIITTAYTNPGGYPRAEYFVLVPDDKHTLLGAQLSFDVKSFKDSPIELNEQLMLDEAMGQARLVLGSYLHKQMEGGALVPLGGPAIVASNQNALVAGQFHGTFPQLAQVPGMTQLDELKQLLAWVLKLPKITRKEW